MPQHIALPTGPGDFSAWDPHGAATIWQAWANALQSSWAQTGVLGGKARVAFEPLPADAATVSRVSIVLLAAGDDHGMMRAVPRLAGADDVSAAAVTPPEGGYLIFIASFDTAPGGLPWTVARRNALQAGVDCVLAPDDLFSPLNVDSVRLATDYEPAVPLAAPPGDPAELTFPSTVAQRLTFSGSPELSFPSLGPQDLTLPGTAQLSFPSRSAAELFFRKSS